jgi:hypothetical protein
MQGKVKSHTLIFARNIKAHILFAKIIVCKVEFNVLLKAVLIKMPLKYNFFNDMKNIWKKYAIL